MGDRWTRSVKLLKLFLPVGAVAILATLFLLTREVNAVREVEDATELKETQGFSGPRFAGTTAEGHRVVLEAKSARPDPDNAKLMHVINPSIQVLLTDGRQITATAPEALYDSDKRQISLSGGAKLTADNSIVVDMQSILVDYGTLTFAGADGITASGPFGSFTAERLEVRDSAKGKGDYELVFTGNVRLSYTPEPGRN